MMHCNINLHKELGMKTTQSTFSNLDHDAIEKAMWNGRKLRSQAFGQSWRQFKTLLTTARKKTSEPLTANTRQTGGCTV